MARRRRQQLFGRVQRSDVARDEDRLPAQVDDGGHAQPVRVQAGGVPLKLLRRLQQVLVLLAVKLRRGGSKGHRGGSDMKRRFGLMRLAIQ